MREIEIVTGSNREFVAQLSQRGARFFIFGGTATRFHVPERREPGDLDLLVEPSAQMLTELNAALAHVGAPPILATPGEFAQPNKRVSCKGPMNPLNMDLLTPPSGVDFPEHWAAAEEAMMNESSTRVHVASCSTVQLLLRIGQEREPRRAQVFAEDLELLARVFS